MNLHAVNLYVRTMDTFAFFAFQATRYPGYDRLSILFEINSATEQLRYMESYVLDAYESDVEIMEEYLCFLTEFYENICK